MVCVLAHKKLSLIVLNLNFSPTLIKKASLGQVYSQEHFISKALESIQHSYILHFPTCALHGICCHPLPFSSWKSISVVASSCDWHLERGDRIFNSVLIQGRRVFFYRSKAGQGLTRQQRDTLRLLISLSDAPAELKHDSCLFWQAASVERGSTLQPFNPLKQDDK